MEVSSIKSTVAKSTVSLSVFSFWGEDLLFKFLIFLQIIYVYVWYCKYENVYIITFKKKIDVTHGYLLDMEIFWLE